MTTAKELRDMPAEELNRRSGELRETLFKEQMKRKTGQLDKPHERIEKRRELARILTIQTEKAKQSPAKA